MKIKLVNPKISENFVDNLLRFRGIAEDDLADIKNPTRDNLCDYHKLDNLEVAARYIINAVKDKKRFVLI